MLAGSYPPVPGPAAAATVAAARRAWAAGAEVVVVSPRPSAAPLVMRAVGARPVGRQLARLGRRHGCDMVVLGLEPGWPLRREGRAARRPPAGIVALGRALACFTSAELVVTGELGLDLGLLSPLWGAASAVWASSPGLVEALRAAGAANVRLCEPYEAAHLQPSGLVPVSPLEPGDLLVVARARRLLGALARQVLGPRAPAVRAYLVGLWRRLDGARSRP